MFGDYDTPLAYFGFGNEGELRERQLIHREQVVLAELVQLFQAAVHPRAKLHFQGCAQRLMMMSRARAEIYDASFPERVTLDSQLLQLLNIFLNSYYLNLFGALDNLAWGTTYELALIPDVDEAGDSSRRFCGLDKRPFADALEKVRPVLGPVLRGIQEWLRDVKEFRDPAAHRLPLVMAPGMMSEEQAARYQLLQEQALAALLARQLDDHVRLKDEANAIGKFIPLLNAPRASNGDFYVVPGKMGADQRRLLDFVHGFAPLVL